MPNITAEWIGLYLTLITLAAGVILFLWRISKKSWEEPMQALEEKLLTQTQNLEKRVIVLEQNHLHVTNGLKEMKDLLTAHRQDSNEQLRDLADKIERLNGLILTLFREDRKHV
ncbi:MAG: hypothetical protein AB1489_41965 [Acidobacteriota bacterium]